MKVHFNTKRQKDPTRDQGMKVPYAPAKRRAPKWRWYLILLIVSSPLIYFLFKLVFSQVVISAPGLITLEKISINSSGTGYVDQINVELGNTVPQGHVMVELGSPALDEREHVLQAELNHLGSSLPPSGLRTESLLRNRIELAKKNVGYHKEKQRKVRFLFDQGAATIAELNQAEAAYDRAQFTLNLAQRELSAQLERTRKDQLQPEVQYSNRRQLILAELETIKEQRKRLQQRAPFLGRILDIIVQEGQTLSPGSPILLMGRMDNPYIVAYLDPKYSKYALSGYKATIKFPDGKTLRAQVRENSTLTRRLPSDLSSPIGDRDLMILVKLDFLLPLSKAESIDGLPVTVRFDFAK